MIHHGNGWRFINMNVAAHYRALHKRSEDALLEILGDEIALAALTTSHNYILDYDRLKLAISSRPEVDVLSAAVKEYQFALFALAKGQYRHAFIGIRLFFELMLSTVQFSAHEIDYRMWAKSAKDINWNALKDNSNGVLSVNFINAFNPSFSENAKQYLAIAETVYRECSEFVHGNAHTHTSLPKDISFHKETFLAWHQKAEAMRRVIVFTYAARYLGHIDDKKLHMIEPTILDVLGHLPAVQATFSATTKR
jgi:hypothetical protein